MVGLTETSGSLLRTFYVYILTDRNRRILYTGMTNHLERRLYEHRMQKNEEAYSARYGVHYLVYFETHSLPSQAYAREKEIKQMSRAKRDQLIRAFAAEENACAPHLRMSQGPPPRPRELAPTQRSEPSKLGFERPDDGREGSDSFLPPADARRHDNSESGYGSHAGGPPHGSAGYRDPSKFTRSSPFAGPSAPPDASLPHDGSLHHPLSKKPKIIPRQPPICPW